MKTQLPRLQLCAKDIMEITGKSERCARRLIRAIKEKNGINNQLPVTVEQFCLYTGLNEEKVNRFLE